MNRVKIYCDAPSQYRYCFLLRVYDNANRVIRCEKIIPGAYHTLELEDGCYRVCVLNSACLNPGSISTWINVCGGEEISSGFVFRPLRYSPPAVRVSIRIADAEYPGITPINGGITWQTDNSIWNF